MIRTIVVDDDHLVRKGFIGIMPWDKFGFRIIGEAANGKAALDMLAEREADLLITDLAMPVMSGMELMRQVKESYPHVRLVVLTFHHDFELIQEALRLGAIDYITKVELEQERMEDMLRRISERIAAEQPAPQAPSIDKLAERWSSLRWMWDDELFRRMADELRELDLSPDRLAELYRLASGHWRELLPAEWRDRPLAADEDGVGRLAAVRESVRRSSGAMGYSEEVLGCVHKAVALIREGFAGELHLPDVAKAVNMSRSYFSRCFRDIVGMTFHEFVTERRIECAKSLLVGTGRPIHWVSAQSGYPNEKYFCKAFRQATGLLPSEFRKSALKS
ncbi:response regulator [Paenibacillus flagellatus]|uniref:response regulator n=1 Tax=Paenibacillus flagellatus TaxID=2211139 RepID=UPI001305488D|nr:response regulator [Paenibacillus flagellatus]